MTAQTIVGTLNEVVYACLFVSCFCRLSRSNIEVRPHVRAGFVLMALASVFCVLAPQVWDIAATWTQIAIGAAVLFKQSATSPAWLDDKPPVHIQRPRK